MNSSHYNLALQYSTGELHSVMLLRVVGTELNLCKGHERERRILGLLIFLGSKYFSPLEYARQRAGQWVPTQSCSLKSTFPAWLRCACHRCTCAGCCSKAGSCASGFFSGWAPPHRSSSAPRSWRIDPSSWCATDRQPCNVKCGKIKDVYL